MIRVDETRCNGCGLCVEVCPTGAIRLVNGAARVEQSLCRGCEACVEACPRGAILAVQQPEVLKPVPVRPSPPMPARPAPLNARQAGRLVPLLGAALAFAAREVVPRVAAALLDAWDRRQARAVTAVPSPVSPPRPVGSMPAVTDVGARRVRRRRRLRHGRG